MWQFVKGCVIIQTKGGRPERLLNAMRAQNIPVWDVRAKARGETAFTVAARDFGKLRPLVRHSKCRVHIVGRGGLPFLLRRLWRRPVLWLGMLLAFGAIAFSGTRIMHISIEGNARVPEELIRRALAEQGITRFCAYPETPVSDIAAMARLYDERIAWLSLQLVGSHLTVTVTEHAPRVYALDPDTPCDIVAVKDGVLTGVTALAGYTKLAPGDIISAGDVLIQGEFFPETEEEVLEPMLVHARGQILANVYYYGECVAEPVEEAYLDSGNTTPYRKIALCGLTLYETPLPYAHCEVRGAQTALLTDALLPVTVTDAICCEQLLGERPVSRAEQQERALCEAERLAYLKIPKDAVVIDKAQRIVEMDGVLLGAVGVVTEESIGLEREIVH